MGIRSLTKQIQVQIRTTKVYICHELLVWVRIPEYFVLYLCLPREPLGRHDFQVCVSDLATLFKCRDL